MEVFNDPRYQKYWQYDCGRKRYRWCPWGWEYRLGRWGQWWEVWVSTDNGKWRPLEHRVDGEGKAKVPGPWRWRPEGWVWKR